MNPQYLVAKYIPNLERLEPKNIGVIVWKPGEATARFLQPERIDFVRDVENYFRWVRYWTDLLAKPRLQLFSNRAVTNKTPRFLNALKKTQTGNFRLVDGGEVLEAGELSEIADFLFTRVVATRNVASKTPGPTLRRKCEELFESTGFLDRDDFRRKYPVILAFESFQRELHFDYGMGNGTPDFLFNRVDISTENSVTLAIGKCDLATKSGPISDRNCYSLFDSQGEQDGIRATIEFLREFSVAVDLADMDTARNTLLKIA